MSAPDVVGKPIERARAHMEKAGIEVSRVRSIRPPEDWQPRDAHKYDTMQYVVAQREIDNGQAVELDVVQAWVPPE